MVGVVDVGGGMRDIYGTGVFDWCLDHNVSFDYHIGVSAGSANIAVLLSGQRGRNYISYTEYSGRREYMSWSNFIRTGSYLDLEYIYGDALTNSGGEYPLAFETMINSGKIFKIVATDALTGDPIYFDMHDMSQDDYGAIKGSSCVPVLDKPYAWEGKLLYDGGISDPIPFRKCFEAGCDKVVIILTRPEDYYRSAEKDRKMARLIRKVYPNAALALARRAVTYNRELREARKLEREGRVLIIAPKAEDISGLSTLKRDVEMLKKLYQKGMKDAEVLPGFLV